MPVAGLVLRVASPDGLPLMAALSSMPGVSVGELCGECLPLVLEADSQTAFDAAFRELEGLPQVALVELAFADFSDLDPPARRQLPLLGGDDGSA